jgi:N-formylglutamate deformylase
MPSRHGERRLHADVVLGDRHGQSCSALLMREVEQLFRRAGLRVALNTPFAGGYITERHGQPRLHQHALQIEIRRDLYLNEANLELLPEAGSLRSVIETVVQGLPAVMDVLCQQGRRSLSLPLAAE